MGGRIADRTVEAIEVLDHLAAIPTRVATRRGADVHHRAYVHARIVGVDRTLEVPACIKPGTHLSCALEYFWWAHDC
jgi:hypothetical protein